MPVGHVAHRTERRKRGDGLRPRNPQGDPSPPLKSQVSFLISCRIALGVFPGWRRDQRDLLQASSVIVLCEPGLGVGKWGRGLSGLVDWDVHQLSEFPGGEGRGYFEKIYSGE